MKWTLEYLEKDAIVSAKITGLMDWEGHRKFAEEALKLARAKNSHNFFFDFLDMEPDFTILQVDDLPRFLKEIGFGPEYKIAAIHNMSSPKSSEHEFFRDAETIRSLKVKIFTGNFNLFF